MSESVGTAIRKRGWFCFFAGAVARPEQGATRGYRREGCLGGKLGSGGEKAWRCAWWETEIECDCLAEDRKAFEAGRLYRAGDNPEIFGVETSDWTVLDVAGKWDEGVVYGGGEGH